ncbi:uncharacterized protein LOC128166261 isoform X1 [Crassostrea angulata]|uniref:uncharacterized protein LOC128166261 isoform X1 n=1 Tax=Magallana angulata TaxID=2784310 RepID=UPI0022B205A7|nr:uncharacterized protein LOC128166261 isoform X1 [Crassostrea angulata]XP_052687269.1 uncharacterized protein LOC128166261 isoform X1 [Crassostrea angulata]XP_052687271.1 uncharacterized protein LOC128166261 isoform X1 [Crassostrea angulata]XP_052687272.1 uncharacterized protein LOC128166261 isoform X1 [Crassostrea angulata]
METNELIAIVGGSLAGLVVILIVLAVIIYCACGKRKRRDDKHRRLTHNQSQDTSLGKSSKYGNGIDPRMEHPPSLPKVGSNGLWMGANPAMYAPGKPYYNDNRRPQNSMMRATSEDRLSPRYNRQLHRLNNKDREIRSGSLQRYPYYHDSYKFYYPYMVYQGNPHIYHSQQVPSTYEAFGRLPRSNSYMELYPSSPYAGYPSSGYGGVRDFYPLRTFHSRAVLVEYPDDSDHVYDPYRDVFDDRKRGGKKVQRTHSDLTGTKRKKRERKYDSPYDLESRPSNRDKKEGSDHRQKGSVDGRLPRTTSAEIHEKHQSRDHKHREMRQSMNGVRNDNNKETKTEVSEQELSQTDSAKLRAMQDKSKDHVDGKPVSTQWNNNKEDLKLNLPKDSDEEEVVVKHYEYNGHIRRDNSSDRRDYPGGKVNGSTFVSVTVRPEMHDRNGYDNPVFSEEEPVSSRVSGKGRARSDSNTDGKQVSAAFDFLNNYLSDDEGTEYLGSRSHSPVPL